MQLEKRGILISFKDYVYEEGDMLDAISCGISAFRKKRQQQKQQKENRSEAKIISNMLMNGEGKDLEDAIRVVVEKGYVIQDGQVKKPSYIKTMNKEMFENVQSQGRCEISKAQLRRSEFSSYFKGGELVGDTQYTYR